MNTFWSHSNDGKGKITVTKDLIVDFLQHEGYRNIKLNGKWEIVKVTDNVVRFVRDTIEARQALINQINRFEELDDKPSIRDKTLSHFKEVRKSGLLDALEELNLNLVRGDKNTTYKFFRNGAVRVTCDNAEIVQYRDLPGHVLESEIINFDIEFVSHDLTRSSDFSQFLFRCMNANPHNYHSLISVLGFLSSSFKSPKNEKAIVFCDDIQSDAAEGGTGKSLTAKALSHFNQTVIEDGKNFRQGQFVFQQVDYGTRLLVIDDTVRQFNFESLFSSVTGAFQIEKKYQDRITIPFEDSPRVLITTNYTVFGRGFSFERRILEVEFSNYYGRARKPANEFGREFFNEWSVSDWNLFYNFMITCISHFLKHGISEPIINNKDVKRLRRETSRDFAEFAEDYDWPHEIAKAELFKIYKEQYSNNTWLSIRTFDSWVKIYFELRSIAYSEVKRHGGTRFWQIGPKGAKSPKASGGSEPQRPPVAQSRSELPGGQP